MIWLAAIGWLGCIRLLNRWALQLPRPFGKAIHWIHAMSLESVLIPLSILLRPMSFFSKKSAGQGRPILLVHGYCHNSSGWLYLRRKLAKEGLGPIYTLDLVHPFRSIRAYAQKVQKIAEQIEQETKREDLILIGHSMGGLVCSWYATQLAKPGKVQDVITIGSPLQGTHLARIALGPNGREMERNSEFVQQLKQHVAHHSTIRFYHIGTKTDQLIVPHTSAWLDGPSERQFALEDLGHVGLLFSPRVAQKVSQWLTKS